MLIKPVIKNIYSNDYDDSPDISRNVLEIEDEFTISGHHLDIKNTADPDQGWFLKGFDGIYKIISFSENRSEIFTGIIPEKLDTGEYVLLKTWKDEDGVSHEFYYDKLLFIKGWQDSHDGISRDDYWFSCGKKAGFEELCHTLDEFLIERGFKKPEVRIIKNSEPQKKVVVVKK